MDPEKLIEEVRRFPIIYDQRNDNYKNVDLKEQIWKEIANNLQGGVEECKKRWSSIRDQFRKTLQKRKTSSGQAAAKTRKYKYEDLLNFLTPYITERDTLSNVSTYYEEEEKEEESLFDESAIEESFVKEPTVENEESSIEEPTPRKTVTAKSSTEGRIVKPGPRKRKAYSSQQEDSPASQVMAYLLQEKKAEAASTAPAVIHPVDAFLSGIAPTLKTLSPILLNQAKTKIFSVVQEFELRQLEIDMACKEKLSPVLSPSTSPSPTSFQSPLLVEMGSTEGMYYVVKENPKIIE